jgi:hypothetical protein
MKCVNHTTIPENFATTSGLKLLNFVSPKETTILRISNQRACIKSMPITQIFRK